MIGVPTTAGTGSEAQSYALISDAETHAKMACGDPRRGLPRRHPRPRAHGLRSRATSRPPPASTRSRTPSRRSSRRAARPLSETFSREAWRLLEATYERVLAAPDDVEARGAMQLGAHFAGAAIENSMLGATHACANPLTARYGTEHGAAIAALLPHGRALERVAQSASVTRSCSTRASRVAGGATRRRALARRLEELAEAGGLSASWRASGVRRDDLPALADDAAGQWTGRFNPRPFDARALWRSTSGAY